ncbi:MULTISPECIES: PD-(D/E)XK nuclease family protein [unclassified Neisseria]|uniref:PD-(D/E)XK nuclease family protein n=1 Tax=unclassified Neisseria TaxID=2623750 RepID=UPI0026660967|nr:MULTISPECIES: PD-(D/E)XK nuclease family protein [unclassified Neisseria]MDO1510484.1 PD-(D/E)XK nuclease family protein [Neisseria sp. MVDL19-042950]MDO1516653.1 PD-(D/E)XK nuclease family protein [Neisseria sp. MVDL18-041461]MDO1563799.1 PD-(D/E)XK nuclease family protein [Neisseria sp. MVDL20-010259]
MMEVDKFKDFFCNFRMLRERVMNQSNFQQQFVKFYDEFRCLYEKQPEQKAKAEIDYSINLDASELKKFLDAYRERDDALFRAGMQMNLWQFVRIGRSELKNCEVLGWLMDEKGDHGLGKCFLLDLLKFIDKENRLGLVIDYLRYEPYATQFEICQYGNISERIDIVIKSRSTCLFLEAKVDANEAINQHNSQLRRYWERLNKETASQKHLLFLTKNKQLPHDTLLHDKVILLSWQEIAKCLRQTISSYSHYSPYQQVIFNQLANHFASL